MYAYQTSLGVPYVEVEGAKKGSGRLRFELARPAEILSTGLAQGCLSLVLHRTRSDPMQPPTLRARLSLSKAPAAQLAALRAVLVQALSDGGAVPAKTLAAAQAVGCVRPALRPSPPKPQQEGGKRHFIDAVSPGTKARWAEPDEDEYQRITPSKPVDKRAAREEPESQENNDEELDRMLGLKPVAARLAGEAPRPRVRAVPTRSTTGTLSSNSGLTNRGPEASTSNTADLGKSAGLPSEGLLCVSSPLCVGWLFDR